MLGDDFADLLGRHFAGFFVWFLSSMLGFVLFLLLFLMLMLFFVLILLFRGLVLSYI